MGSSQANHRPFNPDLQCEGCGMYWEYFDKWDKFPNGDLFRMFEDQKLCEFCVDRRKEEKYREKIEKQQKARIVFNKPFKIVEEYPIFPISNI